MQESAPKLAVEHLYKIFGSDPERAFPLIEDGRSKDEILKETGLTVGVYDVSFTVGKGEIFVVMGLSGSGKSTLVRMLNRLIDPTKGTVRIDDSDVTDADAEAVRQIRLRKMAMVFQHFALFPHMTVAQNVEYGLKVRGVDPGARRDRALKALDQVGLANWADHGPGDLSGGMQQRVGLARALATEAELLLMDEPFSALDPLIRREMQEELLALEESLHMTIVFITHDLNEALMLGDRIAIMKDGQFVQVGTPEEIVAMPADDYVEAFTQDIDRGRVFTAASVMEKPEALDLAADTSQTAIARMESLGRSGLYVTDGDRIAGVVTYPDLVTSARTEGAALSSMLRREYPSTRPTAHLADVYQQCGTGLPIAVIDPRGGLRGIVDPVRVFNVLSGDITPKVQQTDGTGKPAPHA